MNTKQHIDFDAFSQKGIDLLNVILSILDKEKTALTERNIEQIKLLTNKKALILADFSDNINSRLELLKKYNLEANKENIALFIDKCPDKDLQSQCQSNWLSLEAILNDVVKANYVNEQIASKNHKNITTILSMLQGQKPNNMLYNAKGSKGDYSGQSRIGKA